MMSAGKWVREVVGSFAAGLLAARGDNGTPAADPDHEQPPAAVPSAARTGPELGLLHFGVLAASVTALPWLTGPEPVLGLPRPLP